MKASQPMTNDNKLGLADYLQIKEAYQQNTEVIENYHPKKTLKAQVEVLLYLIFLVEIRKESAQDLGD